MSTKSADRDLIIVVDDIEETRDAIEKLLMSDGYRVGVSRDEQGAIEWSRRQHPELILMSKGGPSGDVVGAVRRIRNHACPDRTIPVVIFSVETLGEGAEVDIGENTHLVHPDNFDQLRRLVRRLLNQARNHS